jgi:hypothetical protein
MLVVVKPSKRKRAARLKHALQQAPGDVARALKAILKELEQETRMEGTGGL